MKKIIEVYELVSKTNHFTKNKIADEYLEEICLSINRLFDADQTFIGKVDHQLQSVTTLAYFEKDKKLDNFTYSLEHTPCINVTNKEACIFPSDVQELFPKDLAFKQLNIIGYAGQPILQQGNNKSEYLLVSLFKEQIKVPERIQLAFALIGDNIERELERVKFMNELSKINSEYLTINKELDIRNREFEVLNEELQEKNEELKSLNDELEERNTELESSELKYRSIFNYFTDVYIESDPEGTVHIASPSIENVFGYTREEIEGQKTFVHYKNPKEREQMVKNLLEKGSVKNHRFIAIHKNGSEIVLEANSSFVTDETTGETRLISVLRDITDRENSAQQLNRLYKLLEKSNDAARIGTWEYNITTGELIWSKTTKKIHEVPDDFVPIVSEGINYYKEGINREKISEHFQNCIEKGEGYDLELIIVTAKGNEKYVRAIGTPEFNEQNECTSVYGTFQDITQRKIKEKEITLLYSAVNQLTNHVMITSGDSTIEYVNPAFENAFEYSLDELKGKKAGILNSGHQPESYYRSLWTTLKNGNVFQSEITNKTKSGALVNKTIMITPILDENNKITNFVAVYTDLSEKQVAEKAIKKLEEKEILLKEIHHRVKNNLQIVSSLLALQAAQIEDKKYADLFQASQLRVASIALVHEKIYGSKNLNVVNANSYITDLINKVLSSIKLQISIHKNIVVDDFDLNLDIAVPCGLIINEIISNSYKYAFDGTIENPTINLSFTKNDGRKILIVSDNGIGIENLSKIKNSQSLGVSLISNLANQLNAKVDIDTELGKGVKYTLTFNS